MLGFIYNANKFISHDAKRITKHLFQNLFKAVNALTGGPMKMVLWSSIIIKISF